MNSEELSEQRSEQRIPVSLPVSIANKEGVTRDISLSGICFEAKGIFNLGEIVRFAVEIENQGNNLTLNCSGEIVRLVNRQDKVDVSVKIIDSALKAT